jgi:hypothetical protein
VGRRHRQGEDRFVFHQERNVERGIGGDDFERLGFPVFQVCLPLARGQAEQRIRGQRPDLHRLEALRAGQPGREPGPNLQKFANALRFVPTGRALYLPLERAVGQDARGQQPR